MSTHFYKFTQRTIYTISFVFLLMSCKMMGDDTAHPRPSENPVFLTAEMQVKEIYVENLAGFDPENYETDKTYHNDTGHLVVESDWITFTSGGNGIIIIDVQENTLTESRTYALPMRGKPGKTVLQIIQNSKNANNYGY